MYKSKASLLLMGETEVKNQLRAVQYPYLALFCKMIQGTVKLFFLIVDILKNSKSAEKLRIREFNKMNWYKINKQKAVDFLFT